MFKKYVNLNTDNERENLIVNLNDLFSSIDQMNEEDRRQFLEGDFKDIVPTPTRRPFIISETKSLPLALAESFFVNHCAPLRESDLPERHKNHFKILKNKQIFKDEKINWAECPKKHFVLIAGNKDIELSKIKLACVCGEKNLVLHPILYYNPDLARIFIHRGKILEPFIYWKLTKFFARDNQVKISWGAKIIYNEVGCFFKKEEKEQEIDISVQKDNKLIILLSGITPTDENEKKQFKLCRSLGLNTLFVSTTGSRTLGAPCYNPTENIFPEIHKESQMNKLLNKLREFLT